MASMSSNDECPSEKFGDSLQLTNYILDYGSMCHITPEVLGKHIDFLEWHHVTGKKKGQVQIKMCNNNGYPFIATLHNVLLAPDLCKWVIFNHYVNEFGTYLFIPQRVFYGVLYNKR